MKGVYILELEGGHYYVGHSSNIDKRIMSHFEGKGSEWTKKHRPVKVCSRHPNATLEDENLITKALMSTHGTDKVRGGGFTNSTRKYSHKTARGLQKGSSAFCRGTTKTGKKCNAPPIGGTNYCLFHKHQGGKK